MKTLWKKTVLLSEWDYLKILKNASPEQLRDMLDRAIEWGKELGMEEACKAECGYCANGVPVRFDNKGRLTLKWVHWSKTRCSAFCIRERYARKTS